MFYTAQAQIVATTSNLYQKKDHQKIGGLLLGLAEQNSVVLLTDLTELL